MAAKDVDLTDEPPISGLVVLKVEPVISFRPVHPQESMRREDEVLVQPVHLDDDTVGSTGLSLPKETHVQEGETRNLLAILFGSTIPLIIVASYVALLTERATSQAVKDLSTALLGPVIGIVGAVVGFYFSDRHRR